MTLPRSEDAAASSLRSSARESDERTNDYEWRWAAILGIAAFVVRAAWVLELATLPWWNEPPTDSAVYESVGARIAVQGLADVRLPLMSPAYFAFLAGIYRYLGTDPWLPRVLQIGFGVLTTLSTWRLARYVVRPRWALGCAGLVAFGGTAVFFDGAILPESPATLLQVLVVWSLLRTLRGAETASSRDLAARAAVVGATLGGLALLRPNTLVEVVPIAAVLATATASPARRWLAASVALTAAALVAAPLWWSALTGRGMSVSGPASFNLFIGNGPGANGAYRVPPEAPGADSPLTQLSGFRRGAEAALGRELSDAEVDRYWRDRTLDHVVAHPLGAASLIARKVHLFFNARELGSVFPYDFVRESTRTIGAPLVQTGWIAPFALIGLLLALARRRDDPLLFAIAACATALVASVVIAFVTDRFRAPAYPLLVVLAVAGSRRAIDLARADRHAFVMLALALALAVACAVPVPQRSTTAPQWADLGERFLRDGELDRSRVAFEEALARDEGTPRPLAGLARITELEGSSADARAAWERALRSAQARDDAATATIAEEALQRLSR